MCGTIKLTICHTRRDTNLKFYKAMAVPTLLYGSECCTLTKGLQKRIGSVEMKFLWWAVGYTLLDYTRNANIRQELKIFNVNVKIAETDGTTI